MAEPAGRPLRICLIWARFGPYHLARLGGAHRRLAAEIVGLEVASHDATYEWSTETAGTPWRREVALPGRVFEEIEPREMEAAVSSALDRIDPDAIAAVSYSTPDAWAAMAWARRRRRPLVMMSATRAEDAPRDGWRERIKAALVRQFDAALVGGSPHRAYAERLGIPAHAIASPYNVVGNAFFAEGADRARQQPLLGRDLPGLDDPGPFFLASNRFVERKNLDGLLAAYAAYRQRAEGIPWRLLLLGDGALRSELEAQAGEGVVFCGFQQRDALPTYYGRASAFVHPAHMDQWGLVINEAMAAGLPALVSTGAGCAGDLVREGETGWTFAPTDLDRLASLLGEIATMPEDAREAMGRAARERIRAYSPEEFGMALGQAVAVARTRSDRGMSLEAKAALAALRLASRRVGSFHSIPE